MKKSILILIMLMAMLLFSSCSDEQTLTDEDGNSLELAYYEIEDDGFYVYNKKTETFRSVMNGATGYQGLTTEQDPSRYVWLGSEGHNVADLIPEVDNKDNILVLVIKDGSMPESYVLEKYKRMGYTIGVNFTFGETGDTLYLDPQNPCETSMAEEKAKAVDNDLLPVHRINGSKELPFENIDTDINMLLGLEKDKRYRVNVFEGTKYTKIDFIADTIAFKSEQLIPLETPYIVTEDNYFVINLPKNLKSGYYYINDGGLFKYTAQSHENTNKDK